VRVRRCRGIAPAIARQFVLRSDRRLAAAAQAHDQSSPST
jgi:hypothetical protein